MVAARAEELVLRKPESKQCHVVAHACNNSNKEIVDV